MEVDSVESLCQKARQAIAQGKIETARQVYLQALGLQSDSPDVHYGLATVCFLLNDLDSSAYHFKEVTRLDPTRAGAHVNLGAVYNRLGEHDEAIKALRRGIQLDPRRAEGYYNLGLVYRNKGQQSLAVQAYIEATRLNPRMIDAHYNLANLYLEMGKYRQAVIHYRQVLQMRPNWEKAVQGLQQAEAAKAAEEGAQPKATIKDPIPEPVVAPPPTASADLQRPVDPNVHGSVLTVLHAATIESETQGREFLQILEQEIEPAIKELSVSLLRPDAATLTLGQLIEKFENAIQDLRSIQRQMQGGLERVRSSGEKLFKT